MMIDVTEMVCGYRIWIKHSLIGSSEQHDFENKTYNKNRYFNLQKVETQPECPIFLR